MQELFLLIDSKRHIAVGDARSTLNPQNSKACFSKKNKWCPTDVSAMANIKDVYEFYKNKLGRISYNDAKSVKKGQSIKVYLNAGNTDRQSKDYFTDNACWYHGRIWMANGEYIFKKGSLAKAKDIVAHEFTHGVVEYETSLDDYSGGTPAIINEAYADIFGCFIDGNWLNGEDASVAKCIRNIKDPYISYNPTKVGGKYFVKYNALGEDDDYGGVHANSTIISHIAYKTNKVLGKKSMKVWYNSLCEHTYGEYSDFYTVRINVLNAARDLSCSKKQIKKLNAAFDAANIKKSNCNLKPSYFKKLDRFKIKNESFFSDVVHVTGKVVEADNDSDYSNNKNLESVVVKSKDNTKIAETNKSGEYLFDITESNPVVVKFSKKGYIGEKMYVPNVNSAKQDTYYCDLVELIPNSKKGLGIASGYIKDSVTTKGIENLKIKIRRGINNVYSEPVCEIQSADNGYYETPKLNAGNYCLEIVAQDGGYMSTYFNIKVFGGISMGNQDMVISKSLKKNQMRAVLTWGGKPRDLDANLLYNLSNGGTGHVNYANKTNIQNSVCISKLDVDDRDGYGPETMTIYNDKTGEYTYYVDNYSNEIEMKNGSNAMVKVYFGNSGVPSYTFSLPNKGGKVWTVFKYNSSTGRIRVINDVS